MGQQYKTVPYTLKHENMRYSKDMLLESDSGFMMPFELDENNSVPVILDYGQQTHPNTGDMFFHKGVDFALSENPLFGIATGTVKGYGEEGIHDKFIIVSYGNYEVEYGHLSECYVKYGDTVKASQHIASSGPFLHIGVRFQGQDMNPFEFLDMIYSNIKHLSTCKKTRTPFMDDFGVIVPSSYDNEMDEIEKLMSRWLPSYYNEINNKSYVSSTRVSGNLQSLLSQAAEENLYYEVCPTVSNPLGLSQKGVNVASKMLDLLIEDFLAFVVLRFNVYPESWSKDRCKEFSDGLVKDGLVVDPLSDMQLDIRSYDIKRVASIYFDTSGSRVWTKAWFNGSDKGEHAIEINREMAIKFNKNEISRDVWLSRFFPKQMQNVRKAVSEAKMQVFGIKQ